MSWRAQFNESELAQIDAAPPHSLLARLARLLDERDGAGDGDGHGHGRAHKRFLEGGNEIFTQSYTPNPQEKSE